MNTHLSRGLFAVVLFGLVTRADAGPQVTIATGANPTALVKFAAEEMAGQLKGLFEAQVTIADIAPPDTANVVLLGSPKHNPAIAQLKDAWPKLSDQGHIVRSVSAGGKTRLVVGGNSPVATLWAAYELGHRFGIRYLVTADVLPAVRPEFTLAGFDVKLEPVFTGRSWKMPGGESLGLASWSLADQQKLVGQLAKLKFNRLDAVMSSDLPVLMPGKLPVDGDTPGRKAFRGAKEFVNPDFAHCTTAELRAQSAIALIEGLRATAARLGIHPTPGTLSGPEPAEIRLTNPSLIILPQSHTRRVHAQLATLRSGSSGHSYVATCDAVSEIDPALFYLARASWDETLTPEKACDELFTPLSGRADVAERMNLSFKFFEEACDKLAAADSQVGRALLSGTEMLSWPGSQADLLKEVTGLYVKGANECQRAHGNCLPQNRRFLYYYTKRNELAQHYLTCVTALDLAAAAKRKGDKDALTEQLEKGVEALYNALNALGEVARDQSDRAVIAVLTEQGYRPLLKELDKLAE